LPVLDTVVELLPVGETVEAVTIFCSILVITFVEPDAPVLIVEEVVVDVLVLEPTIFYTMREIICENRTIQRRFHN
jgi:hypothetical protein